MKTKIYKDPTNPDKMIAIIKGAKVGRDKGFFPAAFRNGSEMRKRVAKTIIPIREHAEDALRDLEKHARRMGWVVVGTMEIQ